MLNERKRRNKPYSKQMLRISMCIKKKIIRKKIGKLWEYVLLRTSCIANTSKKSYFFVWRVDLYAGEMVQIYVWKICNQNEYDDFLFWNNWSKLFKSIFFITLNYNIELKIFGNTRLILKKNVEETTAVAILKLYTVVQIPWQLVTVEAKHTSQYMERIFIRYLTLLHFSHKMY